MSQEILRSHGENIHIGRDPEVVKDGGIIIIIIIIIEKIEISENSMILAVRTQDLHQVAMSPPITTADNRHDLGVHRQSS